MKLKTSTFSKLVSLIFVITLFANLNISAQAVRIANNTGTPDASAILDIVSTTSGILIPRMTEAQRTNAAFDLTGSPEGVLVYQTDGAVPGFYFYNGTDWQNLFSGTVPTVPGESEYWLRPDADPTYIYPEGNTMVKVYDSGETYGIFYDGGQNQYGLYGRTTNVTNPTAAVVGFSDVSGNQTYGYLGFNGTWSPTFAGSGFNQIDGAAVYGVVDDPGRISGFFRTTGAASYAANIAYSDVWTAGFFYGDYIDNNSGGRPALYGSMNTNVDDGSYQPAIWGRSEYTAGTTANLGYTIGGLFVGVGNNQDAYGIQAIASCTGSAIGIGVYGESSGNVNGTDYFSNNIGAVEGNGAWNTTTYNYGVVGRYAGVGTAVRSAGVLGTYWTNVWGALGYVTSGSAAYGLYYTSQTGGTGKDNNIYSSVGIGGTGDLFGSWTKGKVYGMAISGDRYSLYVDGKQYTNDIISQMNDNGSDKRFATYVPTSMTVDVYIKGTGKMINGKATVKFDKNYLSIISDKEPVIVTVTPIGKSNGIYLEEVKSSGFSVAENNEGKSSVEFTWIAIATRKNYETPEIPAELIAKSYDFNLDKFMFNESNTEESAFPMWWDGKELHFEKLPIDKTQNTNRLKQTKDIKLSANSNKQIIQTIEK